MVAVAPGAQPWPCLLQCPTHADLQIKECDDILGAMEEMLGKFQSDLGNISSEIRTLQEQSQSMSIKLKNRKIMQVRGRGGERWVVRGGRAEEEA